MRLVRALGPRNRQVQTPVAPLRPSGLVAAQHRRSRNVPGELVDPRLRLRKPLAYLAHVLRLVVAARAEAGFDLRQNPRERELVPAALRCVRIVALADEPGAEIVHVVRELPAKTAKIFRRLLVRHAGCELSGLRPCVAETGDPELELGRADPSLPVRGCEVLVRMLGVFLDHSAPCCDSCFATSSPDLEPRSSSQA